MVVGCPSSRRPTMSVAIRLSESCQMPATTEKICPTHKDTLVAGSHVMALLDKFTGKETASYGSTDAWGMPVRKLQPLRTPLVRLVVGLGFNWLVG